MVLTTAGRRHRVNPERCGCAHTPHSNQSKNRCCARLECLMDVSRSLQTELPGIDARGELPASASCRVAGVSFQ
jgi:hypothetical protein